MPGRSGVHRGYFGMRVRCLSIARRHATPRLKRGPYPRCHAVGSNPAPESLGEGVAAAAALLAPDRVPASGLWGTGDRMPEFWDRRVTCTQALRDV